MSYEGWANYETWCVSLWLNSEQGSYNYCKELAKSARKLAPQDPFVTDKIWTVEQATRYRLADTLEDMIDDGRPDLEEAGMYSDLLDAALNKVNWHEIAEGFLEE